jgi:HrpA-like RNA helicase
MALFANTVAGGGIYFYYYSSVGKFVGFSPRYEIFCAQIFVVSGETGCGKTTQVPQYILEEAIKAG